MIFWINADYSMPDRRVLIGDASERLRELPESAVDCVVTSPRYNFGKNYGPRVNDKTTLGDYLAEMADLAYGLWRVVREDGVVFLNVGTRAANPLHDALVCSTFIGQGWVLQERFVWLKATETEGHFTPITSKFHVNNIWEGVFLLSKRGDVVLDRLAIGVPYADPTNTKRWRHGQAVRCRGDAWFIPYDTIRSREVDRGGHGAVFPEELPRRCIKLIERGRVGLTVLDPCCGTGTVLAVANAMGHNAIGIDLNPDYANMAARRIGLCHPNEIE